MIENIKFGSNVRKMGLLLSYDKKHHPVIHIGNENCRILIKKFCGRFDMDKFLVEAVLLRMSASKQNIKEVRDFYNRLIATQFSLENSSNEKII